MSFIKSVESNVRKFSERAGMSYSDNLAGDYQELRDQLAGKFDREVFARTLISRGEVRKCIQFMRHPKNRLAMERARERRKKARLSN